MALDLITVEDLDVIGDDINPAVDEKSVIQYPPPLRPCSKRMLLRGDDLNKNNPNLKVHHEGEEESKEEPAPERPKINITAEVLREELSRRHRLFDEHTKTEELSPRGHGGPRVHERWDNELSIIDYAMHQPSVIYQKANIRRADKQRDKASRRTQPVRHAFVEYAAEKEMREAMDAKIAEDNIKAEKNRKEEKKQGMTAADRMGEAARRVRDKKKREEKILKTFKAQNFVHTTQEDKQNAASNRAREEKLSEKALLYGINKLEPMEQFELGYLKIRRDAEKAKNNKLAILEYKRDMLRRKREARGALNPQVADNELTDLQGYNPLVLYKRYKLIGGRVRKVVYKQLIKKKHRLIRKYKKGCKILYMYYIWTISHSEMLMDYNTMFEEWYDKTTKKLAQRRSNKLMMKQLKRDQREETYQKWKEALHAERIGLKREKEERKYEEMRRLKAAEKARKKQERIAKEMEKRRIAKQQRDEQKAARAAKEEAALLSGTAIEYTDDEDSMVSGGSLEVEDLQSQDGDGGDSVEADDSLEQDSLDDGSFVELDDEMPGDEESIDGLSLQPQLGLKKEFRDGSDGMEGNEDGDGEDGDDSPRTKRRKRRAMARKERAQRNPGILRRASSQIYELTPGRKRLKALASKHAMRAKLALIAHSKKTAKNVKEGSLRRMQSLKPTSLVEKVRTLDMNSMKKGVTGAPQFAVKKMNHARLFASKSFPSYHEVRYELETTPRHTGKYSRSRELMHRSDAVAKTKFWVRAKAMAALAILMAVFSEDGPLSERSLERFRALSKKVFLAAAWKTWKAMPTKEQIQFMLSKEGMQFVADSAKEALEQTKEMTMQNLTDAKWYVVDSFDDAKDSASELVSNAKARVKETAAKGRAKIRTFQSVKLKPAFPKKDAKIGNFTEEKTEEDAGKGGAADSYDPVEGASSSISDEERKNNDDDDSEGLLAEPGISQG